MSRPRFLTDSAPLHRTAVLSIPIVLISLSMSLAEAATLTVTTTADTGPGSLRLAILESTSSAGVFDTIAFDIPPSDPGHLFYRDDGVAGLVTPASAAATASADDSAIANIDPDWPHSWYSIKPQSVFPEITDPVTIDGYTQAGAVLNTNEVGAGLNSILRIEIDCSESVGAGPFEFFNVAFWLIAGDNTIRGLALNRLDGTYFFMDTTDNNRFEGIYLGVDISGTIAPGPQSVGIDIRTSAGNRVGGTTSSARNLIANTLLFTRGGVGGNLVEGNLIGTDRSGMRPLQVPLTGVQILDSPFNVIGGEEAGAGNVISGNQVGISVAGIQFATGNVIRGNWIGTGVDGLTDVGNLGEGIRIDSTDGIVIEKNTIAYNSTGITLRTDEVGHGLGNLITQNSIFSNDAAGIDLGAVDANDIPPLSDPPDQDTGPNNLQNYPILNSVSGNGTGITVEGSLQSASNSDFRIEFFANFNRDPSNFGEGQTYLGFSDVSTDGSGNTLFNVDLPTLVARQDFITATATDTTVRPPGISPANDTSEFSPAVAVGGCSFTVTNTGDTGLGTLREAIACANMAPGSQTIDFAIPPDDPGHLYYRDDGVPGQVSLANIAPTVEANDSSISDIDPDWPHSWFSIQPTAELPEIGDTVSLDGYSQEGAARNSNPASNALDTVLKIELSGLIAEGAGLNLGVLSSEVDAGGSRIAGLAINDWPEEGVVLDTFGGSKIEGCFIGTDVSGTLDRGNGGDGILLKHETRNRIGGTNPGERNLISGNDANGVNIALFSSDSTVQGNLIGTDRAATPNLANGSNGVLVDESSSNSIGGTELGGGNRISFGEGGNAIRIQSFDKTRGTSWSQIAKRPRRVVEEITSGNGAKFILPESVSIARDQGRISYPPSPPIPDRTEAEKGPPIEDATPTLSESPTSTGTPTPTPTGTPTASESRAPTSTPIPSLTPIVTESPIPTQVSADSHSNSSQGNSCWNDSSHKRQKGIGAVTGLAIDLGADGVTENDGDNANTPEVDPDSDIGPNHFQNYPELQSAVTTGGTTLVGGFLLSVPDTMFRIEFFSAAGCSTTGHGPAEVLVGFETVTTDGNGMAPFSKSLSQEVQPGDIVVATATRILLDNEGETSELSACIPVTGDAGPCPTPFPDFNNDDFADAEDLIELFRSVVQGDGVRDLTEDGQTNGDDILKFSLNWQAMDCSENGR